MSTASPEACANLDDVLYWCFITMKQVERLYEFFAMYTKESSSDEKVTGYSPEQQRISILVAGDIHFLLTAVTNLIKATSKRLLPDDVKKARLDIAASEKVEHLRNIYEHWEKTKEAFSKNREKVDQQSGTKIITLTGHRGHYHGMQTVL